MSQAQHGLPHLDPQKLRKRHVQLIRFRQCKIVLLNSAKTNCYDQFALMKQFQCKINSAKTNCYEVLGFAQMLTNSVYQLGRA